MKITLRFQHIYVAAFLLAFAGVPSEGLKAMQGLPKYTSVEVHRVTLSDVQDMFYKTEFDKKIRVAFNNETVEQALKKIAQATGLKLTYRGDIMVNKRITLKKRRISVSDALSFVLEGTGLEYRFSQEGYLLIGRPGEDLKAVVMQEVVTGQVTDASTGETLPGVNIIVKGTTTGTSTDADGEYELTVESLQDTLVFSFIGYQSREVPINGRTEIDIAMELQAVFGEELVVTALGIQKDNKSITYATQGISGEEISNAKEDNFVNSLAGKIAGAVVTKGNSGVGSSTRILLRGNKSFTDNSEPLFVINGVPIPNDGSGGGVGDLISNFDAQDIESIQVLKGASAAALYGSQASNGVVMVTTKKGVEGITKINFSSSVTFEDPVGLPELQTNYGQGMDGEPNTSINDSWGPKITNGSDSHLEEFFKTGKSFNNRISFSKGTEEAQYYVSYGNTQGQGILPKNDLTRNNLYLRATTRFFDKLSLDGSIHYMEQKISSIPGSNNPIADIYAWPTGDDFSKYSGDNFEVWDPGRQMYVQNYPYVRNETFPIQNPYWVQNRNPNDRSSDRTILSMTADYDIFDWLDIQGRATYTKFNNISERRLYVSTISIITGPNGSYGISNSNSDRLYYDILLRGINNISENISVITNLGFSNIENNNESIGLSSTRSTSLSFPNHFSINSLNGNFNKSHSLRKSQSQAVFGSSTVSFKDRVFLDLTARNEWSSTVEDSYFFPSAGLSYVLKNTSQGILSFAKVRGSYAEVGSSVQFGIANPDPGYSLNLNGDVQSRNTLPFISSSDTTTIKPERTKSFEFGTDLRFFNDKLILNLTYYNTNSVDQVFQIAAPAGSGAQNFWLNGGIIRNDGIEGILSYNTTAFGNVQWTSTINFSYNRNQIRQLSDELAADRYVITDWWSSRMAALYLTRPEDGNYGAYGDLYGKVYQRDENGKLLTNENGIPLLSESFNEYVGNANPDYLAGFNTKFQYKRASLSFLIDGRFGGGVVSSLDRFLDYKGLSKRTGEARDNGGVMVNGNLVDAQDYYMNQTEAGTGGAVSEYFYDSTNIRLRELSIGYDLPEFISGIDLDLSLVGRNLFFFYKKAPFDPEITRNTSHRSLGIAAYHLPSTRSLNFTLRVSM